MIRDLESKSIEDREKANLEAVEKVRKGEEQFSFALESSVKAAQEGLGWNQSNIDQWNQDSVEYGSAINRVEHADAWAIQRDINYAYSGRKRLMDIGMDSRFSTADGSKFCGSDLPRMSLEDPETPTEPSP